MRTTPRPTPCSLHPDVHYNKWPPSQEQAHINSQDEIQLQYLLSDIPIMELHTKTPFYSSLCQKIKYRVDGRNRCQCVPIAELEEFLSLTKQRMQVYVQRYRYNMDLTQFCFSFLESKSSWSLRPHCP